MTSSGLTTREGNKSDLAVRHAVALRLLAALFLIFTIAFSSPSAVSADSGDPITQADQQEQPTADAPAGAPPQRISPNTAPSRFDVEAAVREYLDRLSPQEKARSDAYFEGGYWIQFWNVLIALLVAWLLLRFGWSAAIRTRVEDWMKNRPNLTAAGYAVGYNLLVFVLTLPWTIYTDFWREHNYGLATQSFGPWFAEELVGLGVSTVGLAIFLVVIYALIRHARASWHLWGAGASIVLLALALFVSPVAIEPLFNTYKPMPDGPLKQDILSMARANGIPADQVYVVDASRQTTRISANVSGLFGTTRIALNDNLLDRGTPAEIRAVMGHEMGHYVLNHAWKFLTAFVIIIAAGFTFVKWGFARLHARHGAAWGVRDIADPAGFPLFAALLTVFFFIITPLTNTISRSAEAEADIFGLNAAMEPDGFASIAMKLSDYRKIDPGPIEEFVFYDHPSGRARVTMAMRWKAEHLKLLTALAAARDAAEKTEAPPLPDKGERRSDGSVSSDE
ncbi:MAG: M48 family peptidase [Alphaproteobacteria bacterium]|nr:MAG: M48 family peptidase [Alphaproteobacteria bacterium]